MFNPGMIFFKAMIALAVAVLILQYARGVATVEVTVFEGGAMHRSAVGADSIAYRDEVESAEKRALPFYAAAALAGLIGVSMVRKSYRVFRKTRAA